MNYRHAYHAGSHTDVFKHAVLVMLLEHLRGKPKPFTVLDTHAGAGRYDVTAIEAGKTGEAADGIGRVIGKDMPAAAAYLDLIRRLNPDGLRIYPGSPAIIAAFLRDGGPADRLRIARGGGGKAPPEFPRRFSRRRPPARRLRGDQRLRTACLRAGGLVFIDPPYEKDDRDAYSRLADRLNAGLRKWPTGMFAAWYPLKDRVGIGQIRAGLQPRQPADACRRVPAGADRWRDASPAAGFSSPTRPSASRQGSGRWGRSCSPLSTRRRAASPSTGGFPRREPHPVASRAASNGLSRPGSNGARSTWPARPSRISPAMASPVAGALSMPQTLWPVAT